MGTLNGVVIPVTGFEQNCALLWDDETKQAVVVDPGGDVDRIVAAIQQAGVTVERIWLTHGHLDHAGGADELRQRLNGVPIEGPDRRDEFLLQGLKQQGRQFGWVVRNVAPDRWLAEGDSVSLGVHRFDVLHCPGHTPGHVVYVNRAARFALVGDVVFQGSIGRTDFPMGNHQDLIDAITGRLWPLGEDTAFVPGHGPMSTFGQERRTNPFVGDRVLAGA